MGHRKNPLEFGSNPDHLRVTVMGRLGLQLVGGTAIILRKGRYVLPGFLLLLECSVSRSTLSSTSSPPSILPSKFPNLYVEGIVSA